MRAADVALLRVISQQLAAPAGDVAAVVEHLTCVQAQDLGASRSVLALRCDASAASVDAAASDGRIVRSWPMRGTLHWLLAADLGWMLALTRDSTMRAAAARHRQLGIEDRHVADVRSLTRSLVGDGSISRSALRAAWAEAGVDVAGQRFIHLLQQLALDGVVCLGPIVDGGQELVLVSSWVVAPRVLAREPAIVELAQRYLRSHGPASMADFCWWSKLLIRDVKPLWEQIVAPFAAVSAAGRIYYVAPEALGALPDLRRAAGRPMLLPGFDELILGYTDRSPVVATGDLERVVPGKNGMFLATVLHHGRVVATWRRSPAGPQVTSFGSSLPGSVERALPRLWRQFPG